MAGVRRSTGDSQDHRPWLASSSAGYRLGSLSIVDRELRCTGETADMTPSGELGQEVECSSGNGSLVIDLDS